MSAENTSPRSSVHPSGVETTVTPERIAELRALTDQYEDPGNAAFRRARGELARSVPALLDEIGRLQSELDGLRKYVPPPCPRCNGERGGWVGDHSDDMTWEACEQCAETGMAGAWTMAEIADILRDYLPPAVAYQWAEPIARELVGNRLWPLPGDVVALRSALREMRDAFLESTGDYARDIAHDDLVAAARLLGEPEPERRKCEDCGEPVDDPGEGLCLACSGGAS